MYTLPQEIEVWYVIPAIRKELAKCMIKTHRITYEKVGKELGISKAAISQYLGNKRAGKISLPPEAIREVCRGCQKIVDGKSKAVTEIQRVLKFIREKHLPCKICGKIKDGVMEDCKEIVLAKY
jgi:predicted transcriptional regulator